MERQNPSIFNDIVGPIMVGPSSSHTCAPSRIGYTAQQLLSGNLKKCVVEFAREGAYTKMYKGQRSDMGYVNGLLGRRPEDPRLRNAFNDAKNLDIDISFKISDFPAIVPNISHLTLESDIGEKNEVYSDSTGGGTFRILEIDGFKTDIVGDCYAVLAFFDSNIIDGQKLLHDIIAIFDSNEGFMVDIKDDGKGLINVKRNVPITDMEKKAIEYMTGIECIKILKPILTVPSNRYAKIPFTSSEEMLAQAKQYHKELWELGIEYEMIRSGWNRNKVIDYMKYVIKTMENSSKAALKGDIDMAGIIQPTARKIEKYIREGKQAIDMGVLNLAIPWAMATMEYSSAQGVVLCAPTGGSAGVFPGSILGVCSYLGYSLEEKLKAMFVTSVIGIVMSKDCNYSAELYGCQVEPGAASGMAAGGLVYLMGGTPEQSCMAASCAIQNILGTICDPVAGLVQIPCINRNAISVANAVLSANLIMGGFNPLIPLDQTAETLFRVGKQLPSELRCTCHGGLCVTPCGERLAREQEKRDDKR